MRFVEDLNKRLDLVDRNCKIKIVHSKKLFSSHYTILFSVYETKLQA